jgi:hypothetical protein
MTSTVLAMDGSFDEAIEQLVAQTATALAALALKKQLIKVNERDHLQPSCVQVARELAPGWKPPAQVKTQVRFVSPRWPRLGWIDLAFVTPGRSPVALELKCSAGRDAVAACGWDALKLALLLSEHRVSAGYLVAAAPVDDWQRRINGAPMLGAELFADGHLDAFVIRARYMAWWKHWERLGDPTPNAVPRTLRTRAVCQAPFVVAGANWELRAAAVLVDAAAFIDWPSVLAADQH